MASLHKRGKNKNWYISYYWQGKKVIKALKTPDAKLANTLKKELEVELSKGLHQEPETLTVRTYFQEYLADVSHRKPKTNRNELYLVKNFLTACGKKTINAIKEHDVRNYLEKYETKSPLTYNRTLASIKRFFRLAVKSNYILKNPAANISQKKFARSAPRFFTDEEYSRIENAAEAHVIYPMIAIARYTGLRLGELIHLEWEDWDWEVKTLRVRNKPKYGHSVKNYQERVVPISDELRDKLLPYIRRSGLCFPSPQKHGINGLPYYSNGPKRALKSIFKRAGVRAKGWHDFRHTFASRLVQRNVPIYKVSKWLGHSRVTVTEIYSHLAPSYDQDIEKLSLQDSASEQVITKLITNSPENSGK